MVLTGSHKVNLLQGVRSLRRTIGSSGLWVLNGPRSSSRSPQLRSHEAQGARERRGPDRGQAFLLDASVAALVYVISAYFVLSGSAAIAGAASDSFHDFSREKQLYEASEVALRSAERGFVEKGENRILHHEVLESKIAKMGNITVSKDGNEGMPRIALCGGKTCVLRFG